MEKASFGAGCFWGVEAAFSKIPGVASTAVGFMGGNTESPSYGQVGTGTTGHTETMQLEFDEKKASYEKLLETFWEIHDPTRIERERQYRSVIFYHSEKQKQAAEKSKKETEKRLGKKVMTAIEPAKEFWRAEDYHQKFYEKHGGGSCHA